MTWIVNWNIFRTSSFVYYTCDLNQCILGSILAIQSIQLPKVGAEDLRYEFSYSTAYDSRSAYNGYLALQSVTTPYGSSSAYTYLGGFFNGRVYSKTLNWTD